jgi:cobalamin biosynthetic protein CobC
MALRSGGLKAVDDHGGSLEKAGALFPDAPKPWIDLSTGVNPHPYPLFSPAATALTRLPEEKRPRGTRAGLPAGSGETKQREEALANWRAYHPSKEHAG